MDDRITLNNLDTYACTHACTTLGFNMCLHLTGFLICYPPRAMSNAVTCQLLGSLMQTEAVHVNQTSACKDSCLPFSIVALTHHGAAPKVCFHWEPSVCVHTNTVHSRHTTKIPHWSCVRVVCVKDEGVCVCVCVCGMCEESEKMVCVKGEGVLFTNDFPLPSHFLML